MYHLHVKNLTRTDAKSGDVISAVAKAAYRAGVRLKNKFEDGVSDFTNRTDVVHSEIALPSHAPAWMADREALWNAVDAAERRKDARLAREVEFALPRDIPKKEWIACARAMAQHYTDQGLVVDMSIHEDGTLHNPHVHLLLTTRHIYADGFGKKNRDVNGKVFVIKTREKWAEIANASLEAVGSPLRIDPRSNEARGIEEPPTRHRGPNKRERTRRRKERTERMKELPIVTINHRPLAERQYYRDDKAEVFRAVDNPNDRIAFDDPRVKTLVDRPGRYEIDEHDEPELIALERENSPKIESAREELIAERDNKAEEQRRKDIDKNMHKERLRTLASDIRNLMDDPNYLRKLDLRAEEQAEWDDKQRRMIEEWNRYDPSDWDRQKRREELRRERGLDDLERTTTQTDERDLPVPDPEGRPIHRDELDAAQIRMLIEAERLQTREQEDAVRAERERLERERQERQAPY